MEGKYELFRGRERRSATRDSDQASRIRLLLSGYPVVILTGFLESLTGQPKVSSTKLRLVDALTGLLDLQTPEEYAALLSRLSPPLRGLLERLVFADWLPLAELERDFGLRVEVPPRPYYDDGPRFLAQGRMGLFMIDAERGHLGLQGWMRELLLPFAPKPGGWLLGPLDTPPPAPWSAVAALPESLPLFRRKLREIFLKESRDEVARKGLRKTLLRELREASDLPRFGLADGEGLDSAELLARFLALFDPGGEETGAFESVKLYMERFFGGVKLDKSSKPGRGGEGGPEYLAELADTWWDSAALLDHLYRRPGTVLPLFEGLCPARRSFRAALDALAALDRESPGAWADARRLFEWLRLHLADFILIDRDAEEELLGIKADSLSLGGRSQDKKEWESYFPITGPRRGEVLARPLFEQYVYLFAVLGLLEIAETEPPRPLLRRGKALPISPADCLAALRLTDLGRWCLGHAEGPPSLAPSSFEALADSELLLVTFKGSSLERRLYLDQVATPIGPERWRFTEARFIEGCDSPERLEARIADFRRLIAAEPSARWTAFFEGLRLRSRLLFGLDNAFLLPLPADPEIRRIFLERPKIRALVRLAEGGSVVLRAEDLPALVKLLRAEGIWAPEFRKTRRRKEEEDWG